MFEEPHIYIKPFLIDELESVKGWNGMISPEGQFYKVSQFSSSFDIAAHDYFAGFYANFYHNVDLKKEYEEFKLIKTKFAHILLSEKDILINLHGFVNYEFRLSGLEIKCPNYEYKGHKLTNKQIYILSKLNVINKFSDSELGKIFESEYSVGRDR